MTYYYFWFTVFAIIIYFVVTDPNSIKYIYLIYKNSEIQIRKVIWWIKNNPRNPIVKFYMNKKYEKLAKELMKEMENKNE